MYINEVNTVYISKVNKVVHKYQRFSADSAAADGSLVVRVLDYRS